MLPNQKEIWGKMGGGYLESTMFWSDVVTTVAYYTITIQLLFFVNNPKVNCIC